MLPKHPETFDYHGWKGNGDSWASAHFTGVIGLWLLNEESLYQKARQISNSANNLDEASDALKVWLSQVIMGDSSERGNLASDLLQNVLNGEINWTELANAFGTDN